MQIRMNQPRTNQPPTASPRPAAHAFLRAAFMASCLAILGAAALPSAFGQTTPYPQKPTNQAEPKPTTLLRPEANRLPDANDIMAMRIQKAKKADFEAANAERKRQLDEDSLALLNLAAELNDDLEKNHHTPSPDLRQKLEEIERLAHNVQVKMKLTMSAPS
jgi:hypothetical protein